jgi:hypothetical protein
MLFEGCTRSTWFGFRNILYSTVIRRVIFSTFHNKFIDHSFVLYIGRPTSVFSFAEPSVCMRGVVTQSCHAGHWPWHSHASVVSDMSGE